jgi:hypothetical protein
VGLAQRRHRVAKAAAPGAPNHVSDEEDSHWALTLSAKLRQVAERSDTGEIVKRALAYPYPIPAGGKARPLPDPAGDEARDPAAVSLELDGRTPLLAYGSNAAPAALARKLAALPDLPLPVLHAELDGFDVVYSAHVSPYGAVPATLRPSPGTSVAVHVAYPDAEQLPLLAASEPNYELARLREVVCRVGNGADASDDDEPADAAPAPIATLTSIDAFLSRHGALMVGAAPLALAAVPARHRRLPSARQPEVLELVRSHLSPDLTLEQFILGCVEIGGVAPLPQPLREVASGSA